jgi:hypothetical protein
MFFISILIISTYALFTFCFKTTDLTQLSKQPKPDLTSSIPAPGFNCNYIHGSTLPNPDNNLCEPLTTISPHVLHMSQRFLLQDTLLLSLHNFLSLVFARLPAPRLSEFQSTATKLKRLREENDVLRQTLVKQRQQAAAAAAAASSEK